MKSFFIIIDKLSINKYFLWVFTTFLIITLLISFLLKINLSNLFGVFSYNEYLLDKSIETKDGGVVSDLRTHWEYIILLKEDLSNLLNLTLGVDTNLINYPLHNLIFSQFGFINSLDSYLISVFTISFFLPIILYFSLKERFQIINKSNIVLICSLILVLPVFQYSAIWGNNHNTALIFFTLGIFYFNSFINSNFTKNSRLIISIIFFSLACYSKQFYVFFFIFLLIFLFKNLSFKRYLLFSIFILLISIPGIYFLILNPLLFYGIKQNTTNFNSSILISASIMMFYLIPFIIQNLINSYEDKKFRLITFYDKKFFLISLATIILCSLNFYYDGKIGGGAFLKLSHFLFDNHYLVFPTAFLGIYFLLYFSQNSIANYALVILLLFTFSTGYFIFQKYFEPMFYIIFLNFFDKNKIVQSIKKNNYVIIFYYCLYYFISNYIYFLGL
jgi:hypothetical protein